MVAVVMIMIQKNRRMGGRRKAMVMMILSITIDGESNGDEC